MKVKFKTLSAGPTGVIRVGDIVDVSESEAELLVKVGCAEYVTPPPAPQPVRTPDPQAPKEPPKPRKKEGVSS